MSNNLLSGSGVPGPTPCEHAEVFQRNFFADFRDPELTYNLDTSTPMFSAEIPGPLSVSFSTWMAALALRQASNPPGGDLLDNAFSP
jgi:hypothetical protein